VELTARRVDEQAARAQLRRQIARLEAQLGAFPPGPIEAPARPRGPRVLTLGELERVRDSLVVRVADARCAAQAVGERRAAARDLLERMLREPRRHKFVRITARELGEPGCGAWHVRPRLGLIGMLAGWWQVKLSSGCPLAC
jgi:hypothetical protein